MVVNGPEKAKKGISRIIFSRTGLFILLILLQVATVIVTTKILQEYTVYIHGMLTVLGVLVLIYIINSEGNPGI